MQIDLSAPFLIMYKGGFVGRAWGYVRWLRVYFGSGGVLGVCGEVYDFLNGGDWLCW